MDSVSKNALSLKRPGAADVRVTYSAVLPSLSSTPSTIFAGLLGVPVALILAITTAVGSERLFGGPKSNRLSLSDGDGTTEGYILLASSDVCTASTAWWWFVTTRSTSIAALMDTP